MIMFSEAEQKAVEKHLARLQRVRDGGLTAQELADMLIEKRVSWMKSNLDEMLGKYEGLPPEEQAYNIVYFDHMEIIPSDVRMMRLTPTKIRIESYNFCPYLEACSQLGLDTRFVCKDIGEPSIQAMVEMVNPNLRFSRDYEHIRPHNGAFCEEFIELARTSN
jgi:hypothetical protein